MTHSGWKVARESAWAQFGRHYWRWFVFGPLIMKVSVALVCVSGLALGGMYVWDHAPEWGHVLGGWLATAGEYLGLILVFGVSLALYSIAVFIIWRVWGWLLEIKGVSLRRYSMACAGLVIFIGFCVTMTTTL